MTTKTYDKKPKFDPNQPFEVVEGKPEFDPNQPFEVVGESSKKKVGSIAYPKLESEAPSISKTPNEIVGLANEYNKISGRISEIEKPVYGTGFVGTPKATSRDKNRLTELESEIKDAGYNPKEIISEFGDFPVPAHELDIKGLLKEKKENPLSFERTKAAYKSQVPLFRAIREKDPDNAEAIISGVLQGQQGATYEQKRLATKNMVDLANKYIEDEDERRKIVNNIAADKAFSYGIDDEEKMQAISQDERYLGGSGLNKYQIQGLQFLEDTDPEKAKLYSDRVGKRPESLWGDADIQRGYEYKARELESFGMSLELNALQEKLTDFKNKKKEGTLTPEEGAQYVEAGNQYETLLSDIENQKQRFPKVAALEADRMYQEAMGQRNGAVKRGLLGIGENVGDALNTVNDFLMSPFRNKEERVIDDLEDLGNKKFTESVQRYKTAANTLIGEDGKLNLTTGAVANTMSDVGSEIISSIGIGAVTGMPATKAGRIGSMFASTFATAYNDYYTEGIEKNVENPTTYALLHTTKEAVTSLINNDLAVVNKFVNPKSTLALIAKNITKKEWDDIALKGAGRFSKAVEVAQRVGKGAVKNAFKEDVEEVSAQLLGNAINMGVYNEDVDLIDGVGATIVNTTIGTLPFGGLGAVGEIKSMNRNQKYHLYEAAQNKDKYLPQLDRDVAAGVITQEKADKIKTIIEKSAATLNELSAEGKISEKTPDNEKVDILAKEVQTEDAKTILQEAVAKGKVKGTYAELAAENPDKVLKDISQQAQNLDGKFNPHNDGKEEASRQAAEETFGNKIVEAAIALYPKKETSTPMQEGAEGDVEIGTTDNTNTILEKAEKKGGIYSELAKAIKGFLGNVKTVVTDAFKSDVSEHGDYGQNEIAINNKTNKNKLHIFFHEALHHITREKIQEFESNPNSKNLKPHEVSAIIDLKRIFKKVTEELNKQEGGFGTQKGGQSPKNIWLLDATGNKRGLANVHEFISEAFTNPEFQKILKDFKGEGKSPTIFKQFLDAVAKMLGLKDPTILDDIFHHTEKLTEPKAVEQSIKETTKAETQRDFESEKAKLIEQRDERIREVGKPEVSMPFLSVKELSETNDSVNNKHKQNEIKERYETLRELLDCLYGKRS